MLELASHLERKATQLCREGFGRIKMALAGIDISSLLEILEGSFGHVDLGTTTSSVSTEITEAPATKSATTEKPSEKPLEETSEKASVPLSEDSSLANAEFVFPLKSIPLVTAGSLNPYCPFMVLRPCPVTGISTLPVTMNFHKRLLHVIMYIMII